MGDGRRGTTDDMGAVIFEGLEFGWYMMVEAVPNPDYAEWWESADPPGDATFSRPTRTATSGRRRRTATWPYRSNAT
ncbi:MAG: hypothetical protein ACLSGS_00215 [Adlercreutzia sp.]